MLTNRSGALGLGLLLVIGCGDDTTGTSRSNADTDVVIPDQPAAGVSSDCGSVRLTSYDASEGGWCEFSRTHEVLPDFVREGLTFAIAEPYNGSSYEGEPGESCGECWEVDTISSTQMVMMHDLCPIEGNPLCAGGHFHFDLSQEAASALGGGGLDAAQTRRVPCPVTGNIHAQINDRNEWGYVRLAFVNHRIPIRTAQYRAADGEQWLAVQRSGGAWHVLDDNVTFAEGSPGGVFRFTSPTGEVVEGSAVLTYDVGIDSVFDTGAQFHEVEPSAGACMFLPPGEVYADEWGGIDQVRWQCNPWGDASCSEVTEDCADQSTSCVLVGGLAQWAGFHIYYRQSFPTSTFSRLSLELRARSGGGEVVVAASHEGTTCEQATVLVGDEWVEVSLDVASSCTALSELNAVTVSNQSDTMDLLVDEIRFE